MPVIYAADDLTTHGVIVGMTGSGKTGLGIDLIEEALLNGISCLVIDPKGDMGNLALNFPDLEAGGLPAVGRRGHGRQGGQDAWRSWRQPPPRCGDRGWPATTSRRNGCVVSPTGPDITIYTPGSSAGVGLNVLGSLAVPDLDWDTESEVIRDEIGSLVSSLLVLAGVESDPVAGQEHILLATIIEHLWREGRDLDLATLVGQIPKPPFRKMGVFDVDTFFPEKDRMALALRLNGLLASPSFATWMEGRPLDIEAMIGGDRPQAAIVYMSHLTDEERQFLVTLLLGKMVTWIRVTAGDLGVASPRLHGRGVRVRATNQGTSLQEADPHDLQTGSGPRGGHDPVDAEPGRPRLQGDVQRRDVDGRASPDRERQEADPGGIGLGIRRYRHRPRRQADLGPRQAPVRPPLHQGERPAALQHPLGDVLSGRASHPRPGDRADERPAPGERP